MDKDILSVSNSILLSGILIAVSIFFSGKYSSFPSNQNLATKTGPQPTAPIGVAERNDAPREGNGDVIVYEFSDFQCPFCQQFWNTTYKQLKEEYIDTDKITFIYRQFPIASIHPFAQKAAEASECANQQGKFFEYHDALFGNSDSNGVGLAIDDLKQYADDLGLDTTRFNSCLDSGDKASIVAGDLRSGQDAGVTGTPTFFINGKKYVGALPYAQLKQIIDSELN